MIKQPLLISTLAAALLLTSVSVFAADKVQTYGSQMMTEQERIDHRTDMQNAKTKEERAKVRNEHHERMKERAKEQGVSIPDKPPVRGNRMGNRQGVGQGVGQGMGQGMGNGRGNR